MKKIFIIFSFLVVQSLYCQENENIFELSFQSFIQTNDLENAEKIARKANKIWPNDIKWEKRLAEIFMWTNREKQAIELYYKIYKKDKNINLEKIKTRIGLYNEDFAENVLKDDFNRNPNDKNFRMLFNFYKENGDLKKAEKLIENYSGSVSTQTAKEIIDFYIQENEPYKAVEYADKLRIFDCDILILKSNAYFLSRNFQKANEILSKNYNSCKSNKDYLYAIADISFMNMDFETGIKTLEDLFSSNNYREQDAEKLITYYSEKNPNKAGEIALMAYNKFRKNYFLNIYFTLNIDLKGKEKQLALIEENSQTKELKEYLAFILNLEKIDYLTLHQLNDLKTTFLKTQDQQLRKQFLWKTLSSKNLSFKKEIAQSLTCIRENDSDILLSLSYLKAETGFKKEALECFKKSLSFSPSLIEISLFGDFLRQAGYVNEALFFERKAYDKLSQKQDLSEEEATALWRLSLNFKNSSGFKEKIQESSLSQRNLLEIILSYLSMNELYEEFEKKLKESPYYPDWAKLYIAKINNDSQEIEKFKDNPNLRRDLASFYAIQNKKDKALNLAYEEIENSQDDYESQKLFNELTQKFYPYSNLGASFTKRDFLKRKQIDLNKKFYLKRNFYITYNFYFAEYDNNDKDKFLKSYLKETSNSLGIENENISLSLGYRDSIKTLLFISGNYKFEHKNFDIATTLKIKEKPFENSYLETAAYKNLFSFENRVNLSAKNSFSLIVIYSEYKDQKDKYLGNSFNETLILNKTIDKTITLSPYLSHGDYSKSSYPDNSTLYKVLPYYKARVIPENYNEAGISVNIAKKGPDYRKKWEFPIFLSFAYNNVTHFIYSAELNIKSCGMHKNYWLTKINYSKGSSSNNDTYFSISQIFMFR